MTVVVATHYGATGLRHTDGCHWLIYQMMHVVTDKKDVVVWHTFRRCATKFVGNTSLDQQTMYIARRFSPLVSCSAYKAFFAMDVTMFVLVLVGVGGPLQTQLVCVCGGGGW